MTEYHFTCHGFKEASKEVQEAILEAVQLAAENSEEIIGSKNQQSK